VDISSDPIAVQRQIGYLPENAPLYPEMGVGEYLVMMAELRGVPADQISSAVIEAAEATDLVDRLQDSIATLSKGYRQRVGLAQAIVHKPDVLVLDEPTNGLDPTQIRAIRGLIARLAKSSTIILSTHILQEIEAVCDRILVMIQGSLVADASLDELLTSNAVAVSLASDLADDARVARCLEALDGVVAVTGLGVDDSSPDSCVFRLDCQPGASVVQKVIDVCRDEGWSIMGIGPERRTLEVVFRELQSEHLQRVTNEGAAA
jgi:ABC-2 type transport system ATP-binding protein